MALLAVSMACRHLAIGVVSAQPTQWTEDFSTDPVAAGRFSIPPGHDAARFTYDGANQRLTAHYETELPTAWYLRPLDSSGLSLGPCDDFSFAVTFGIRAEGFEADEFTTAQIAWGLVNANTTGGDRACAVNPPPAFDIVTFDYFPNETFFGGPTAGVTVIHSDAGGGFFSELEFAFGAETEIDTAFGDEKLQLGVLYAAVVDYDGATQIATLTVSDANGPLATNADGAGGPGGFDGDPTTIQTPLVLSDPFAVDAFALTLWQDTCNPGFSSVIADVDVYEIAFSATPLRLGDVDGDGFIDGRDIGRFIEFLLTDAPSGCDIFRADFDQDGAVTFGDVAGFSAALVGG